MLEPHSLLARQIRRSLTPEEAARPEIQAFLEAVNDAYLQSDTDRLMLERSLELSSQELLQANSEMRGIFQALPDLFLRLDESGTIVAYKASTDLDLYVPAANLLGKRIQDVPTPEAAEKFKGAMEALQAGARMAEVVYQLPRPEGESWYEARLLRLLEDQVIAVIRNVTDLRRAEEERRLRLERVERQQSTILGLTTPEALAKQDLGSSFHTIAEEAARALEVDRVSIWILGADHTHYQCRVHHDRRAGPRPIHLELLVADHRAYHEALRVGTPIVSSEPRDDVRTRSLPGAALSRVRVASLLHVPIRLTGQLVGVVWFEQGEAARTWHDDEIAFGGVISDQVAQALLADDRKRQEAELLRAQKLESLGALAGGIAHDFNNTLTGILGNLSLALTETDPDSEGAEALREAEAATVRATSLTRQLLTFATGGKPVKRTVSLTRLLQESVAFALRGSNVRASFNLPDELPSVDIDPGQMGQVIHNLVLNADQAMPNGGTLNVSAEAVHAPTSSAGLGTAEFVRVAVSDEGSGISPEHLPAIFDPYFTTKQGGTGLGLASSYSIIRNHGGEIDVTSEVGIGSTFWLRLPVSRGAAKASRRSPVEGRGEGRRILVMDDEESIRSVVQRMLERLGYAVESAANGEEALETFIRARRAKRGFDVVILDLTVPGGMGGLETLRRMRLVEPEVRAIVCSGYSNDPVMADFRKYGFQDVIGKPFRIQDLDRAVRAAVGTPRPGDEGGDPRPTTEARSS